jgi:hypothetical protein
MAHSTPDIRSTAACLWFTLRCAYRFVLCAVRCPRSSPTVCKSTPAITSLLAKVCRLQCQAYRLRLPGNSLATSPRGNRDSRALLSASPRHLSLRRLPLLAKPHEYPRLQQRAPT